MKLLAHLKENHPEYATRQLKRFVEKGRCSINGVIQTYSTYELQEGDKIKVDLKPFSETPYEMKTLYEDDDLLIIDKPPGVISEAKSLPAIPVHRLDKETSGALILAKSKKVKEKMKKLFSRKEVKKLYLAVVDKEVKEESGKISKPIDDQKAITFWKCLKRGNKTSLLACEPITGRTHQIRLHLLSIGHPILGDYTYAKRFKSPLRPDRHLLHAYKISFRHPMTGEPIEITCPVPKGFDLV